MATENCPVIEKAELERGGGRGREGGGRGEGGRGREGEGGGGEREGGGGGQTLTSKITFSRVTTFSTRRGSKVSSNCTMCGRVLGSERSLLARGRGRTMAFSSSREG